MYTIELKNVSKSFKQANSLIKALDKTNFKAKKGDFISVIGPSGSGKSTFLTIAGGLQTPDSGEVFIAGKNFSKSSEKEKTKIRNKYIGFVLQSSNLVPFLRVNDQFRLHNIINSTHFNDESATKLLRSLEIEKLKYKYPNELSGGELQRVAIAKAIYHSPKIVLLDEPTASLDTKKAVIVVKLLQKLSKEMNTTIIMVTHDIRMNEYSDMVYQMKDGVLNQLKNNI